MFEIISAILLLVVIWQACQIKTLEKMYTELNRESNPELKRMYMSCKDQIHD